MLLLAGGVGIAPIMGLLRDLAASGDTRPVRLAYAAGIPRTSPASTRSKAAKSGLNLGTIYVSEQDGPDWAGAVGRLDRDRLDQMLDGLRPQAHRRLHSAARDRWSPAVSDTLLELGLPMENIVYERFDYGGGAASRQDAAARAGLHRDRAGLAAATLAFVTAA